MRRILAWLDRPGPAVVGLIVVLLAIVVAEAVLLVGDRGDLPEAPAVSSDIARDFAVAATSFDFRTVDRDIERVLAFGDPGFVDEFRAAMGEDFAADVVEARRVSVGEITAGPQLQRLRDGRAVFLVVVTQQVASLDEDDIPSDPQLVRVGMLVTVETDDDPRVTAVEVL